MASDIQVYVRFKDQCVFAGEEVNCTITFKNAADLQMNMPSAMEHMNSNRRNSISQLAAMNMRGGSALRVQNPRLVTNSGDGGWGGHKATMSLSTPLSGPSDDILPIASVSGTQGPTHKHQRSISIISGARPTGGRSPSENQHSIGARPSLGQSRSSTAHSFLGPAGGRPRDTSTELSQQKDLNVSPRSRSRSPLAPAVSPFGSGHGSRQSTPDFKFPADGRPNLSVKTRPAAEPTLTTGPLEDETNESRILSDSSIADSTRSSTEFHSLSNHSQETLVSEQPSLMPDQPRFPSARIRQHYRMGQPTPKTPTTAKLLMGYAQVNASFTLDGSLVDQSPFEEIKRKGFLGGQAGGGVVGVKKPAASAGFLGGFNLNSIGDSIGNLMGTTDMSSVKEMRAVASSRVIPLLSTPQSLLFVDLQLAPGEESSYSFVYTLPRGLPSSHRGKAIRITYNLNIGIQGAPRGREVQTMRHLKVPIRVFSGVNGDGEIFGHDLMQPHVILRDSAHTAAVDRRSEVTEIKPDSVSAVVEASTKEFLQYANTLLDKSKRRQSSTGSIDALTNSTPDPSASFARQAINRAILFCNQVSESGGTSPNRFDIARGGLAVAVITLDRPLHRLGETITAAIDFSEGQLPCLNLRTTLETTENVNPALAVRSAASISRVTKKVYASHSENTLFAQRVVFGPSIPVAATPTLLTSGVNLDWSLRFEFSTARMPLADADENGHGQAEIQDVELELLEEVSSDERGSIAAAVETIDCESFEVVIPITVFGDIVTDKEKEEQVVGLPI